MEENENKTVEVTEEEVMQPSREEILAMSREENKNGDEMKKNIYKTGSYLAFRIGIIIAIIISAVSLILGKGEELMLPMYSVVFGMMSTQSIYIGLKEKKKGLLALAIVMAVSATVLTVLTILMICGVIL
ncbi:MAG: hypothetical protein K2K39_01455 [Clostridia bacterium]|nr:hypothetical protein [Clostridia bacterium]